MSCGGLGMMQVSTLQNPSLSMMSFGGNKNLQVFVSFICLVWIVVVEIEWALFSS